MNAIRKYKGQKQVKHHERHQSVVGQGSAARTAILPPLNTGEPEKTFKRSDAAGIHGYVLGPTILGDFEVSGRQEYLGRFKDTLRQRMSMPFVINGHFQWQVYGSIRFNKEHFGKVWFDRVGHRFGPTNRLAIARTAHDGNLGIRIRTAQPTTR
jgi:hypothetical protein